MSSSVPIGIKRSRSPDVAPPDMPPVAAGAGCGARGGALRRTGATDLRVVELRLRDAAAFFGRVALALPARLRAALFRDAVRLRPAAALRFPLPPARELVLRLRDAARLVFFLPRAGILLLREL